MQIMPDTARQYGFDPSKLSDPDYNVKVAAAIGKDLLAKAHGDPVQAAIGYNAGPGMIGTPFGALPKETRDYVAEAEAGLLHIGQAAYDVANNAFVEAQARIKASAANPLGAAGNLEQTPARALAPFIEQGLTPQAFAQAFYDALNPGTDSGASQRLVDRISGYLSGPGPFAGLKKPDGTPFVDPSKSPPSALGQKIDDFVTTFVAQTIADPVSYVPVVGWLGKTAGAARVLDVMADGARAVGGTKAARPLMAATKKLQDAHAKLLNGTVGETYRHIFGGRPELDPILEPHAKAARLGFEHREIANVKSEIGDHHDAILAANKDALRSVGRKLPFDVQQGYLQEPWRYGTSEMRQQALDLNYQPSLDGIDAPWAEKPTGELHYNLRKDYQFLGQVNKLEDSPAFKEFGGSGTKGPAFEHEREGNWRKPEADQYERVRARLRMGQTALWQRRANAATRDYLETHGGWKAGGPLDEFGKPNVEKLSTGPVRYSSPLRFLGRWGTQAVQGTVLPHAINNVGTLTFLDSPSAVGRAVGYMAKPLTEAQVARIKNIGAFAEYTTDPGSVWSNLPGSKQALHGGQAVLSRMEMAYRQGLLDELDRTLGPSVDADGNVTNLRLEMEKGARIRDAVVDYRNIPRIVAVMEALGAPFAPFFGGAVRAVGRAAVRHPERVAAVQRGEKDVQDQFGWTFPNPVNTAERLFFDPGRTLAERSGVIPAALGWTRPPVESGVHFDTGAQLAAEIARTAGGPWISQVAPFLNLPYDWPEGVHFTPIQGLMQLLAGAYPYHPPSPYTQTLIEKAKNRAMQ